VHGGKVDVLKIKNNNKTAIKNVLVCDKPVQADVQNADQPT
jgi:hypothetical protein